MTAFTVDPAQLHAHASEVSAVSTMVDTASSAAAQVGLGGDAYGYVIGPIMTPVLSALLPNTGRMIKQAAELGDAIVEGLRSNSDVYQRVEDEISQSLK